MASSPGAASAFRGRAWCGVCSSGGTVAQRGIRGPHRSLRCAIRVTFCYGSCGRIHSGGLLVMSNPVGRPSCPGEWQPVCRSPDRASDRRRHRGPSRGFSWHRTLIPQLVLFVGAAGRGGSQLLEGSVMPIVRALRSEVAVPALATGPAAVPATAHAQVRALCSGSSLVNAITAANAAGGGTLAPAPFCTRTLTSAHGADRAGPVGLPPITAPITLLGAGAAITRDAGAPAFRTLQPRARRQRPAPRASLP